MLRNTFCHIPGIGPKTELSLWRAGITTWQALLEQSKGSGRPQLRRSCAEHIVESLRHWEERDPTYFAALLSASEQWRLFQEFRGSCAYLDIETTGLGSFGDHITTITIYDGQTLRSFVHGENLNDFPAVVRPYPLLVTYNGTCFDLPFLERHFNMQLKQAHIDLRYVLKSLGLTGGLKGCERRLGIERKGMENVDGFLAVLLWREYKRKGNRKALETLLAYNVQDVLNLEILMVEAHNRKLRDTPFVESHRLSAAVVPRNPFTPDAEIINRLRGETPWTLPFPGVSGS